MSKNNNSSNTDKYQRSVDVYHHLFERGLEQIRRNQLPDKIILDILKKYSDKLDTPSENSIDSEFFEDRKHLILLATQEELLDDNQELINIKEGYEEVLNLLTHEFKNLLTTAQGYNLLLENRLRKDDKQELLDLHYSSNRVIKKLFNMVDSILKMSLSEKELLKPDYRLIDFNLDILAPLESELDHEFSLKSMRVKKKVQAKKTMIMADEQLIEIIMRNLLENAAKYGDNDSTIEIIIENEKKNLIVTVKNKCRHLPENICNNIFEKFKTVKLSNMQAGTGIGLYNVKNLLRLHHGDITCTAVTHKWIKFRFYLPLEPEKESA